MKIFSSFKNEALRKHVLICLASVLAMFIVLAGSGLLSNNSKAASTDAKAKQPNIIFILTDDLDVNTFNSKTMPRTYSFLKQKGTTVKNQVIPTATCCPSRASFMSGQYSHNNNVRSNGGRYGGYAKYYSNEAERGLGLSYSIGSWLQNGGYRTAFIGKYLNNYGDEYVFGNPTTEPPFVAGWDKWFVPIQNRSQKYFNFKVKFSEGLDDFRSGFLPYDISKRETSDFSIDPINKVAFYNAPQCAPNGFCSNDVKRRQMAVYSEKIFVNQAISFLQDRSLDSKPAFIWYASDAPHGTGDETLPDHKSKSWGGPSYNPIDENKFSNLVVKGKGAWNEKDMRDKPSYLRTLPRFSEQKLQKMLEHKKARWRAMYSLDRELGRLYSYLKSSGEAENTILIFTSDNGYASGQHRIPKGKNLPYREITEFPIIYRGPGIRSGFTTPTLAANIDFAPTVLDLAGVPESVVRDPISGARSDLDGISLRSALTGFGYRKPRSAILLESVLFNENSDAFLPYRGVRTSRYVYLRYYRTTDADFYNCPNADDSYCVQGIEEFYDLQKDPFQKKNLIRTIRNNNWNPSWNKRNRPLLNALKRHKDLLKKLRDCSGEQCVR